MGNKNTQNTSFAFTHQLFHRPICFILFTLCSKFFKFQIDWLIKIKIHTFLKLQKGFVIEWKIKDIIKRHKGLNFLMVKRGKIDEYI